MTGPQEGLWSHRGAMARGNATVDSIGSRGEAALMAHKADLRDWVVDAITGLGGSGTVVEVSRWVWQHHEAELRDSDDLFYTWQYDVRWAAQKLPDGGQLAPADGRRRGNPWMLADAAP